MSNIVSIKNLKKRFGNLHAVDGISFDIKKGEILGFLGPNGAGKSTTIRCLMGFNKPTDGEITICNHNIPTNLNDIKKNIGYLPGNVKLYDNWTGWDHIRFYESVRGRSKNLKSLIERLDYNPSAKFRHLSSGNKQKLGLILALMHQPKLIIMDEPTVGLDPLLQSEIYKILLEMRDNGASILISSHNLPEIERLCDRVVIIKKGKLVAVESIKSLGEKKLHKLEVRFKDIVNRSELEMAGVERIEEISGGYILTIKGDLNPILQSIVKYQIKDIEITHASLEDVFMKFYEKGVK